MQIIKDDMTVNNSVLELCISENQKFESICQQLKNICTVSQKLFTPQLTQKRIRKQRVLRKKSKNQTQDQESFDIQQKKTIPNYFEVSRKELEEKIAIISGFQQQIQQIKWMMSQI